MNVALWIVTAILIAVFASSAIVKGTQSRERAVEMGMTGVVDVSHGVMRLAAISEAVGILGLVVPYATGVMPILTPLAALGLGLIMILAARIHLGLKEPWTATGNLALLAMCLFVAWGRWP